MQRASLVPPQITDFDRSRDADLPERAFASRQEAGLATQAEFAADMAPKEPRAKTLVLRVQRKHVLELRALGRPPFLQLLVKAMPLAAPSARVGFVPGINASRLLRRGAPRRHIAKLEAH